MELLPLVPEGAKVYLNDIDVTLACEAASVELRKVLIRLAVPTERGCTELVTVHGRPMRKIISGNVRIEQ